ncbi:hypothetical protein NDU88_003176 [Pleurodeles waltl]|uniref:Uncharacterized protein n=1 Tax=Pleurodeles waltl TaxID=8319 RepID=A0AAV7SFQ0_PLEWA|nr:hypothetical protein NDU88_003176 [Pleurodeles waltl]
MCDPVCDGRRGQGRSFQFKVGGIWGPPHTGPFYSYSLRGRAGSVPVYSSMTGRAVPCEMQQRWLQVPARVKLALHPRLRFSGLLYASIYIN